MQAHPNRIDIIQSAHGWFVTGEIDVLTSLELTEAFANLPDVTKGPVEVDLAGVTFIDSSGLRVLLELADRVEATDRETVIRNPSPTVTRLLAITQLESRFGLT